MMAEMAFDRRRVAANLRTLAAEFEAVQAVDSNETGFVVRIRALQVKAAEFAVEALEAGAFENEPWVDAFRELVRTHKSGAEQETTDPRERRLVFLRNLWWDLGGYSRARVQRTGDKLRVLEMGGRPLIPSPFDEPELAALALENPAEFGAEAARLARKRAAFVLSTMAAALESESVFQQLPATHGASRAGSSVPWSMAGKALRAVEELTAEQRRHEAREESGNANAAPAAPEFAGATDKVPGKYCEDGRPCGPLEGNIADCVNALKWVKKARRADLLKLHQSGRVWVRQVGERQFELFFRSRTELQNAEQKRAKWRAKRTPDQAESGD